VQTGKPGVNRFIRLSSRICYDLGE
jgi:hypothetical protein